MKSIIMTIVQSPAMSSLLGQVTLLITLFSSTLNLYSSFQVRYLQLTPPNKTSGTLIVLYILILTFSVCGKAKYSELSVSEHSQDIVCP
jgi:hypothetical protein